MKRYIGTLGVLGLAVAVAAGCASSTREGQLLGMQPAPSTQARLKLADTKNKNTSIDLEVKHLAEPSRIAAGAMAYVVWIQPSGGNAPPQNAGAFSVDEDLKGHLKTVVPFQSFRLFVTPEPGASTTSPTGQEIIWASVLDGQVTGGS